MVAGITLGVLAAVTLALLIVLLLVCCCYFRHKKIDLIRALEVKWLCAHVCDHLYFPLPIGNRSK